MEALLYFGVWAALIFLMMRFGCGAHVMGHGRKREGSDTTGNADEVRWVPPEKDTDPVCGKTIATQAAKPSVFDGNVYYFCSRECREAFEAAPDVYVPGQRPDDNRQLEHSHV